MKASELRIGNYYDQFGNIHQVNGTIISQLETAPVGQLWCKPIPLTEEWLLKFGWGKGEFDSEYVDNVSLKQAILSYDVNAKVLCIITNQDVIEITHIHYVHQLQNLIHALTGEELTISNI
jgi:hypothetical protein